MARNIEAKFYTESLEETERLAEEIGASYQAELAQTDIYYKTPKGRLKLRLFPGNLSQLIYYERPDSAESRISEYEVFDVANTERFLRIVEKIFEVEVTVKKIRKLYIFGSTRIHLDLVEGLGNFVELETVLEPEIPFEAAQEEHHYLLDSLGLTIKTPVPQSYREMALALEGKRD
jgi:predicted adenylyl cyclase CyaB